MTVKTRVKDPRKMHKKPRIPVQSQPEAGLDSKLKPRASHGKDTYKGSGKLRGCRALITGGDSGIGRAVAIAFAHEGADVAINFLPSEQKDAEEVMSAVVAAGRQCVLLPGDLTDEESVRRLPHDAVKALGGLDVVVNNAGKQVYKENIAEITSKQLMDTFTVNILAMFWMCQEALEYLKPGASIINTTSIQATQPSPGLLDYATTKGAITTFTKGLAQQLTPKGIRVNAVAPGPIWTPLQPSRGQPKKKLPKFGEDTPLGRPGQPAELGPVYVFLASQDSSYISGEIIGVTGGELL